jgi:hypothetical protein
MSKYEPLFRHLCAADDDALEMTFEQIECLVGPLPRAASLRREWWSNERTDRSAVQTKAWLDAGRQVESIDRAARRVRFSAARWRRSS